MFRTLAYLSCILVRSYSWRSFHIFLHFRAISVLLGEAWKNLQTEEREVFSQKAKVCLNQDDKKLITIKLPPVFILDYGWRAKETSPGLLEEEALPVLGQHALLELGRGGLRAGLGWAPAHPEPPGAPLHLPDGADRGRGAGGRGAPPPRHQHLLGPDPGGRARGLLGAHLQQIGRGLPQGGAHQTVHPAIERGCVMTQRPLKPMKCREPRN